MKHSILFTSLGLCLFSFACGSAENGATADDSATGPQWLPAVEVGEAGATATDPTVSDEANVVQSADEELSLSNWVVQLPDNSTTPAGTDKKPWYYSNGASKEFADAEYGVSTGHSLHCRTEMKENNHNFKASSSNTLTVTGKVTKGSSGITIGQVFNDSKDIPLAELQFTGKAFAVLYEEARGKGKTHPIAASTAVGKAYTYSMSLTKGVLTVTVNGVSWSTKPTSAVSSDTFYFKAGNYDQGSSANPKQNSATVSSTIRSSVEISALTTQH